jgi:DNA-binding transcriptional ArsR family regulator
MIPHIDKTDWRKNNPEKDSNFVKLFKSKMPYLRSLLKKDDAAFSLFLFLAEHMDNKNALVCSMQVLCDYFEVSRQTMSKRIKTLTTAGMISVFKSGTSNVYILNPGLVWSSWANGKVSCKFESNVMLSLSEQEKRLYDLTMNKIKQLNLPLDP